MDIQEIGCGLDWSYQAQDRDRWWALVNTVMNLWVPYNGGHFVTNWGNFCFLMTLLRGLTWLVGCLVG